MGKVAFSTAAEPREALVGPLTVDHFRQVAPLSSVTAAPHSPCANEKTCPAHPVYVPVPFLKRHGPKTLNTAAPCLASEPVSLTAQDIAVLDELTQLGLQLARLLCRAATKFLEAEPEPPAQGADPKTPSRPNPPDRAPAFAPAFAHAFARIARVIQTGITLKNRLVARQAPPEAAPPAMPETASDPRRPSIAAYLHKVVDALPHHPNPRVLHRTIEARIDKLLAADPGYTLRGSEIVIPICTDLGLPYDLAKMHDDLIFPVGRTRKRRIPKLGLDDEPDIEANGHDPP